MNDVLRKLKALRFRWRIARKNPYMILFEENNKRYLTVICTDWRGIRWTRCFELVAEVTVDSERRPVEWKPVLKTSTSKYGRTSDKAEAYRQPSL